MKGTAIILGPDVEAHDDPSGTTCTEAVTKVLVGNDIVDVSAGFRCIREARSPVGVGTLAVKSEMA